MVAKVALLICLASTLFMTGLIWFVQVVHYPLFGRVETAAFARYHADHVRSTGPVVVVPMLLELATSLVLVVRRPIGVGPGLAWAGLAAAAMTWASTALVQVPQHGRLASGFDPVAHRTLVRDNWARVVAWSAHALIALAMAAGALR